mgnify:CR=1 FL=1
MSDTMHEKECVLVADDIAFGRGILKMLLRNEYDVLEAADGAEAIACLEANASRISCVLLDIKMPAVDGYGVMDYMRRERLLDRMPVIALTSVSDPQGQIRCYESGAIDLIEKPYDEDVLLYKIRWNIARFRRLSACPVQGGRQRPIAAVEAFCARAFSLESEEEAKEMAASFLRTFGICAERLRPHESSPDFAVVRDVTHDINGFAANGGANDLADLNMMLNTCAKAENAEATAAGIRRILALYEDYRA